MNDKTFKTVRLIATLIPAVLILFIGYLNSGSPFYIQPVEGKLQGFADTMPAGYEKENFEIQPHGSLSNGACSLLQYDPQNCQGNQTSSFIKPDVKPAPLDECKEMFTWVEANNAKYFLYNQQAIDFSENKSLAQIICVDLSGLQFAGSLNNGFWESNFTLGMMQITQFPGDMPYEVVEANDITKDYDEVMNSTFNAIKALGNYSFKNSLHRNLTITLATLIHRRALRVGTQCAHMQVAL
mgnify:CR=1 FL=1